MKTYGTLTIVEGDEARSIVHRTKGRVWLIQGEPHVMTRIKRLFAKVDRASMGRVALSDTAENARELAWFMERYPLDVDPASHVYLERRAEEHRRRETLIHEIISGRYRAPTPRELAIPLREYQRQARDMVLANGCTPDRGRRRAWGRPRRRSVLLVDPRTLPALVVTLTHLTTQWARRDRAVRAAPARPRREEGLGVRPHRGSKRSRVRRRAGRWSSPTSKASAFPDVIVMNYAKLAGWAEALAPHVQERDLRRGARSCATSAATSTTARSTSPPPLLVPCGAVRDALLQLRLRDALRGRTCSRPGLPRHARGVPAGVVHARSVRGRPGDGAGEGQGPDREPRRVRDTTFGRGG
jgi:hypothetical protein